MSRGMDRILFVCSGNICRSPMAEGLFRQKIQRRGLLHRFEVDSAATGRWHIGEPPDPRTVAVLEARGAPVPKAARAVSKRDFEYFDYILVMDETVAALLRKRAPDEVSRAKIALTLSATTGGDVPDPYYGKAEDFEHVADLLDQALERWLKLLTARIPEHADV